MSERMTLYLLRKSVRTVKGGCNLTVDVVTLE